MIIVRFLDDNWRLQQRLLQVQVLAKSMKGEEVARELINTLSVTYGISSSRLLATMRDRLWAQVLAPLGIQQGFVFSSGYTLSPDPSIEKKGYLRVLQRRH